MLVKNIFEKIFDKKFCWTTKNFLQKFSWRTFLQNFCEKIMLNRKKNCAEMLVKNINFVRKNYVTLQKNSLEKEIFRFNLLDAHSQARALAARWAEEEPGAR
jgi:hypothetical protein